MRPLRGVREVAFTPSEWAMYCKDRLNALALKLALAAHEAAHVVAAREFAGVGSRVTFEGWGTKMGYGETQPLGSVSRSDFITILVAALVITDEMGSGFAPGLLNADKDWEKVRKLTGLTPDELRVTPGWKEISAWLEDVRLQIAIVTQEILDGREIFGFPETQASEQEADLRGET